jgi:hypothetical protein
MEHPAMRGTLRAIPATARWSAPPSRQGGDLSTPLLSKKPPALWAERTREIATTKHPGRALWERRDEERKREEEERLPGH